MKIKPDETPPFLKVAEKAGCKDIKPYNPASRPLIYQRFQEMARAEGIENPQLFTAQHDAPFCAAILPENVIIVSDKMLALLDDRETVAIIAHEIGHCTHRYKHMAFTSFYTSILGAAIGVVAGSRIGNKSQEDQKPKEEEEKKLNRRRLLKKVAGGVLGYEVGRFAGMPLERSKEREADREAVRICGDKEAIISALEKLEKDAQQNGVEFYSFKHGSVPDRIADIRGYERSR
jgi:Zn-dependent protease with chaperone function